LDLGTAVKYISLKKRDGIYTHGLGILLRYGDCLAMVGNMCGGIFCIKHHHLFCNTTIAFSFDLFFLGVEVAEKHMGGAELSDELVGMRKLSCEE